MRALYRLNAAEGQALYGKTYTSAAQLLDMYHAYNTQQPTDAGNEENAAGAAALLPLLPQRLRLTNVLEAALQAVDPSLALPFWDYTVEGEEVGDRRQGALLVCPMALFLPLSYCSFPASNWSAGQQRPQPRRPLRQVI